jgi:CPA2 family monovalent cation:H+ antiporter-2
VLAVTGKQFGIITEEFYQSFLSSSVVTMIMTPFVMKSAPSVSRWLTSLKPLKRMIRLGISPEREGHPRKREGHVIIVGFGLNGRNLARVLKESDVPYVVLETNTPIERKIRLLF